MPLDPITAQVIQNRLSGIVQEMQTNIFRTGYSTIVRESQDASCMILDASGDNSPRKRVGFNHLNFKFNTSAG